MCHKKCLHLLVLNFPPLIVTISPGGGETGLLQTVVVTAVVSVLCRNTVADGAGMVADVGGALQLLLDLHYKLCLADAISKNLFHASTCSIWK